MNAGWLTKQQACLRHLLQSTQRRWSLLKANTPLRLVHLLLNAMSASAPGRGLHCRE
jgi:hypothetical protein